MRGYSKTIKSFEEASSAIGGIIALGKKYKEEGMQAVEQELIPLIQNGIDEHLTRINRRIEVSLRILPGYATALWFLKEVSQVSLHTSYYT